MHVKDFFQKQNPLKLSCSPDPTTNSEITNPNFHIFFYQLEQLLQVHIFCEYQPNCYNFFGDSGLEISIGSLI